jgi:C4-dicarboxylate transporter DctM subunit
VGPLNAFVRIISQQVEPAGWIVWGLGFAVVAGTFVLRRWRRDEVESPLSGVVQVVIGVACALLLVLGIADRWNPVGAGDAEIEWAHYTRSDEGIQGEELQKLSEELDDLVFGDTGIEEEPNGEAASGEDRSKMLAVSVSSQKFPVWLAQAVLPLSFLFMAMRFFMMSLTGSVGMQSKAGVVGPPPHPGGLRTGKDLVVAGLVPGILLGFALALGMGKGWLLLLACILLIIVGAPLFLAIGVAALASVMLIQDISGYNVAKDMFEAVKKEELLAIPFFVLAGNIMTQGSIATRLVNVARAFMGRTPGGLGLATVFACVVFAAISGSSPVTVIAVGSIMFPMLVRERYPENYSIGVLTSAGSLGIIIPPSVPMIIYAIMVSNRETPISANDLFIGGVLPGLFIAAMLVAYTLYATRPTKEGIQIAIPVLEGGYGPNLATQLKRSFLSLLLPVLILGGIYGILGPIRFTVTEAAAVAVVYALAVELLFHRELRIRDLPKVLTDSGVMMGSLFLIIVLAMAFNKFLAERYIPQQAAAWLGDHVHSQWQFIILVNLFLLAIGCVMDIISAILIVAPLLAPIAASFGMDPIHFGIMFIVNLELGYLTPPMGINLFVASTVFERTIVQVIRASLPFLLLMLFCLAVIAWVPWLSTVLVR